MKANEVNLNRFLSQSDTQFIIPVYQRNYDWTAEQCKQLLADIFNVGRNSKLLAHFIGSIVYIHDDVYSVSTMRELTIIDGQQRLTTVTLIYIVLYRLAESLGNQKLKSKIEKTYLINEFAEQSEKIKLRPTENNDRALKFLLKGNEEERFSDFSRLIDNFNYFHANISEENYEVVLNGLNKLMFVEISLDKERDDPQRIFESLNSTGLELSQSDLIRNYILMGLPRVKQKHIYETYWENIECLAKEESTNTSRVSDYIRDYLTLENKKIPIKDKVYQEFKAKYPTATVEILEENLKSIKNLACHYNKIVNPNKEINKSIKRQIKYINRLEINVVYPFLLKVYDDHTNNIITAEVFVKVLELIQSFTWRRFIAGLPTNALNKIFMRLYEDVDLNDYLGSIERALLSKKGNQRFPKDMEVTNALKEKDMYSIKPKNRSYFLEKLENFNNNEFVPIEGNTNITIEHIFPQNPDPQWRIELGEDQYNLIKEKYLNTIANLTLSGNNGNLGNKSYISKRDMNREGKEQGYKYSRLWLNRYLAEIGSWNIREIEKRFEIIKTRFWKYGNILQ